jgi:AcrR family transcriptional regulator
LLQTSLSVFARRDFDAVSVREIVDRAGANIAAVSYHFGGKRGLYLATAEFLADAMQQKVQPQLSRLQAETPADAAAAQTQLAELIETLVGTLLLDPLGDDAAGFILREQLQPTAAFDILFARLMQPMQQAFQALLAQLDPNDSDDYRQVLRTHALMGQILAFRTARETLLRRLGRETLSPADVETIARQVTGLTLRAVGAHPIPR